MDHWPKGLKIAKNMRIEGIYIFTFLIITVALGVVSPESPLVVYIYVLSTSHMLQLSLQRVVWIG